MSEPTFLRRVLLSKSPLFMYSRHMLQSHYATTSSSTAATQIQSSSKDQTHKNNVKSRRKFFTLPPYASTISGSALGKALSANMTAKLATETSALKWVLHCCPELPRNLVQKLFRLRQVKKELLIADDNEEMEHKLKRVMIKFWFLLWYDWWVYYTALVLFMNF